MLAMWHRLMTRPFGVHNESGVDTKYAFQSREWAAKADTHLVATNVLGHAQKQSETLIDIKDIGTCLPISDSCWVEFSMPEKPATDYPYQFRQVGVIFKKMEGQEAINEDGSGSSCMFVVQVFSETKGMPFVMSGSSIVTFAKADGLCNGIYDPKQAVPNGDLISRWSIVRCLYAFAFAHCKNVNLVTCAAEHGPNEKFCKRAKVARVIYKSLKIPGFTNSYLHRSTEASESEMRSHICRGHFAKYTADKPLFGRPDGVGKFWHPAHVRGNAKHGAVVKDYEVKA